MWIKRHFPPAAYTGCHCYHEAMVPASAEVGGGSETAQHCHIFFLFFSIYQLQASSLTNHTDVVNRQTPFSPLRNHSPFLSLSFPGTPGLFRTTPPQDVSKIIVALFVSLIYQLGPEQCMSGLIPIARELLIVPVWVYKLETCGMERTLEEKDSGGDTCVRRFTPLTLGSLCIPASWSAPFWSWEVDWAGPQYTPTGYSSHTDALYCVTYGTLSTIMTKEINDHKHELFRRPSECSWVFCVLGQWDTTAGEGSDLQVWRLVWSPRLTRCKDRLTSTCAPWHPKTHTNI